jgi:hypothetical protein
MALHDKTYSSGTMENTESNGPSAGVANDVDTKDETE